MEPSTCLDRVFQQADHFSAVTQDIRRDGVTRGQASSLLSFFGCLAFSLAHQPAEAAVSRARASRASGSGGCRGRSRGRIAGRTGRGALYLMSWPSIRWGRDHQRLARLQQRLQQELGRAGAVSPQVAFWPRQVDSRFPRELIVCRQWRSACRCRRT
jgi:hypothetical protein